jgi:hypothetical protein
MAKNLDPIYPKTPRVRGVAITAGNVRSDGAGTIGTDIFLVGTVSPSDGAFLRHIELWPTATTPTTTTATVARAFLSTQSVGATTAASTQPIGEMPLAAQSAANASSAVTPVIIPVNKQVEAGMSILVTNHAAPAANTAWKAVAYFGDYDD